MIKFFRHIRKSLFMENKTSKYLKYAIGEIILVIIGILIALQINNWNESQKLKNDTLTFAERLKEEINQNIVLTKIEIERETSQVDKTKVLLNMFSQPDSSVKPRVIDSLLYDILTSNAIDIKMGTLQEGLNTGQVAMLQSNELKSKLYSFPSMILEIKRMEQIESEDINTHLLPYIIDNSNLRAMDNEFSKYNKDIAPSKFNSNINLDLLESRKFENIIDNRFWNTNQSLENYNLLMNELQSIQELLENQLVNN